MKKSVFATLLGLCLGILMMIGVIYVLNMKPDNEEMMAQNNKNTQSESDSGVDVDTEIVDTEDVVIGDASTEDIITEDATTEAPTEEESENTGLLDEILDALKPETEKETEKKPEKEPEKKPSKKEPVDYPYYIRVNREANCVTVYKKDKEGNYTVPVKAMVCSVGLNNKTRLGIGTISDKYTWRQLFGGLYGQYAVRFDGHILFHSVPYTQMQKDTLWEGQYNMLGQPASQGCVRLAAIDAKWIYDNCIKGTKVEVYDSPDPGPLGKPVNYIVSPDSPYAAWDPTDPDPLNPWNAGVVSISGVKNITITQGEEINLLDGIKAKDADGTALEVKILEEIDLNEPGTYTVTYSATGATRVTVNATVVLTIEAVEEPETEESDKETEKPETEESDKETEKPETEESDKDKEESDKETEKPETEESDKDKVESDKETEKPETEESDKDKEESDKETEKPETEESDKDKEESDKETEESETEKSDKETEKSDKKKPNKSKKDKEKQSTEDVKEAA